MLNAIARSRLSCVYAEFILLWLIKKKKILKLPFAHLKTINRNNLSVYFCCIGMLLFFLFVLSASYALLSFVDFHVVFFFFFYFYMCIIIVFGVVICTDEQCVCGQKLLKFVRSRAFMHSHSLITKAYCDLVCMRLYSLSGKFIKEFYHHRRHETVANIQDIMRHRYNLVFFFF